MGSALGQQHQPIHSPKCHHQRAYSGINIVLLWDALFSRQFEVNQWLTFKQALALGGNVQKGERGTTVVYADSFIPKKPRPESTPSRERG